MSTSLFGDPPGTNPPCMMCGADKPHDDTRTVRFGMTCKGTAASAEEESQFIREYTFRTEVSAAYGETLASQDDYMESLAKRNADATEHMRKAREWVEKGGNPWENPMRAEVTHAALQANINEILPEIVRKIGGTSGVSERIETPEFEVQPPMIRVPPKDLSRRGSRIEVPSPGQDVTRGFGPNGDKPVTAKEIKDAAEIPDSALFLNEEQ